MTTMVVMTQSLISTKIHAPRLRPGLVSRPHLIERLKAGLQCPLTLISAPAGYGKTTLIAVLANYADLPVAWLSLDEGDNDPVRFWTHFISSLQTKLPQLGNTVVQTLKSLEVPDVQSCLTQLINEIVSSEPSIQPCILILDDYHLIEEKTIHKDLSFIIEHLPWQLRIVISTRADPPFPLARMRARGQLSELRAQDLRFTVKETRILLNNTMGLGLSDKEVAAIDTRTEGWIASLQMAAISMQKRENIPAFIAAFSGTHRHVLDYLTEEVLNRQTADTRAFLLKTSILDRMTGSLCDVVTRRQDGQEILEWLDKANLFVISLDDERKWYRYHNLFSSMLRSRLQQSFPDNVNELRKRAAIWFQQNGFMEEAISQALATDDFELSSELIEKRAPVVLVLAEVGTLLNWLVKLPETTVQRHPGLCIFYAFVLTRVGRVDAAEVWLRQVEGFELTGFLKTLATMTQAMIATAHQDDKHTIELLVQVLKEKESLSNAGTSAEAVYSLAAKLGAATILVEAQEVHGQLRKAIETCQLGLSLVRDKELEAPLLSMAGLLHVRFARILCEQNNLEGATQHIIAAREIGPRSGNKQILACISIVLGLIRQAEGDDKAALDLIRQAEEIAPDSSQLPRTSNLPWRLRFWFAQGNFSAAARLIQAYEPTTSKDRGGRLATLLQETVSITLGHISLCEGKFSKAETLLARVQQEAEQAGRLGNVIEILLLRALAARALGNVAQAINLLDKALKLAEPEGYIRVFVDLGMPMATLLRERVSKGVTSTYTRKLLTVFEKKKHRTETLAYQPLVEPLTERELEVLRLLADGLSNEEIADKLVLTTGTIKTHAHNIYAKLGVRNRAQAIKRATSLNLL
jgi:LuxR family maltose regulon positive regulatory protein